MKKYTREEIENGVREIIANVLKLETDEVKLDDLMKDGIGCDSLDCVEIVIELEKEFGISIPDNTIDAAAGWTVRELCDYVNGVHGIMALCDNIVAEHLPEKILKEQKSQ